MTRKSCFKIFPVGPLEGVPEKYILTSSARMSTDKRRVYTAMKVVAS